MSNRKGEKPVSLQDAQAKLREAKELQNSSSAKRGFNWLAWLGDLDANETKYENVVKAYRAASDMFKAIEHRKEAAQALQDAADVQIKHDGGFGAAATLEDAFNLCRNTDPEVAAECMEKKVQFYESIIKENKIEGKKEYYNAAHTWEKLGKAYNSLYEKLDTENHQLAVEYLGLAVNAYANSGGRYDDDGKPALARKSFVEAGELAVLQRDYTMATKSFEKAACAAKETRSHNLPSHVYSAVVCKLKVLGDTKLQEQEVQKEKVPKEPTVQEVFKDILVEYHALFREFKNSDKGRLLSVLSNNFSTKVFQAELDAAKVTEWERDVFMLILSLNEEDYT
ncbi:hypothetical protein M501DRAFT_1061532 [Patellaria atrata CBS 101060]|uniref:Gamma-soluble NSF attachment protein n=1 Tax=Patellaria atrata CBS 101060 TaxID=1346257 RepID=A0A9P4VKL4_9PEZI|nr:hypothetical protein M501DRAFT_1061532 [Patellaria atrata CBS 101060]